jgi:hypothetical protein
MTRARADEAGERKSVVLPSEHKLAQHAVQGLAVSATEHAERAG